MSANPSGAQSGAQSGVQPGPEQEPRRLLLLRHAKATTADPGPNAEQHDHARDLAERGRHDASSMGRALRRLSLKPDLVLVSSARRTERTWTLLGRFDDPQPVVTITDQLYLAEPFELLSVLRRTPDAMRTVLLIGHNPGIHQLALQLAGQDAPHSLQAGLGTCTLVSFVVRSGWDALGAHPLPNPEFVRP